MQQSLDDDNRVWHQATRPVQALEFLKYRRAANHLDDEAGKVGFQDVSDFICCLTCSLNGPRSVEKNLGNSWTVVYWFWCRRDYFVSSTTMWRFQRISRCQTQEL